MTPITRGRLTSILISAMEVLKKMLAMCVVCRYHKDVGELTFGKAKGGLHWVCKGECEEVFLAWEEEKALKAVQ